MTIGVIVTTLICLYGILAMLIPNILVKLNLVYKDKED